eukprot:357500_1
MVRFNFLRWYGSMYTNFPYRILIVIMAFGTCFVKGCIADCVTQSKLENYGRNIDNKNNSRYWFSKIDWKRNVKFGIWSGLYCGSIQHHLYNVLYPSIFIGHSFRVSLYKSMTDNFITNPFFGFPLYFSCKAIFLGQSWKDGLKNYKNEIGNVIKTYWSIWLPTITLVLFIVPVPFRIATVGCVSLLWLTILSYLSPYTPNEMENKELIDHETEIMTQ